APFGLFAAAPRPAGRIYESAYAHQLDRVVLLSALFREAGYISIPVLVAGGDNWPGQVPASGVIDRILLEVPLDREERKMLFDPSRPLSGDPLAGCGGRMMIRCDGAGKVEQVPEDDFASHKSYLELRIRFEKDRIEGEGVALLQGAFSPYHLVRGVNDEARKFIQQEAARLFTGARVESWNLKTLETDRVEMGFSFEADLPGETGEAGENRVYLSLPEPFLKDRSGIGRVHRERKSYPLPLRVLPSVLEIDLAFEGASGRRIISLPPAAEISNAVGSLRVSTVRGEDGKATFRRRLTLRRDQIGPEHYPELRALLLEEGRRLIILEGKQE
ncbi:MAG: hypothetical protein JXB45_09950, partial [Candidatus Krumholzibacteriota bacterium]|nr:hypothetical protein [Candidatus Krumholzibacteriota bacterium]